MSSELSCRVPDWKCRVCAVLSLPLWNIFLTLWHAAGYHWGQDTCAITSLFRDPWEPMNWKSSVSVLWKNSQTSKHETEEWKSNKLQRGFIFSNTITQGSEGLSILSLAVFISKYFSVECIPVSCSWLRCHSGVPRCALPDPLAPGRCCLPFGPSRTSPGWSWAACAPWNSNRRAWNSTWTSGGCRGLMEPLMAPACPHLLLVPREWGQSTGLCLPQGYLLCP